ncbi:MAG: hypothetical protein E6Q97_33240 [Desulfurellales bacterium]|nr:MAG: hypothetical protein E6Q97_33240 [Desulfurellales bacterium]
MASVVYKSAKQKFLSGTLDLTSLTLKAVLIDTADYTFSAAHDFLDDVPSGARVGTPQTLASKTVTDGVFDAADIAFPSVTGDQCEAIIIYEDSGSEATSDLICYIDTAASGLPVTPNGGNINVAWDNGANKIFAL